ncbi:MAG TPA: Fic family protein [Polyangiaceae bacterium]
MDDNAVERDDDSLMTWTLSELEDHLLIGSTLVEGSTLTEAEARDVLAGRTVSGHPVREALELLNYRAATAWLIEQVGVAPYVSVDLVAGFHLRLMSSISEQAGRFKAHGNFTIRTDGGRHEYLHPSKVDEAMRSWVTTLDELDSGAPAKDAAALYARFQAIHPFDDGNGRVGRLFVSYFLHWKHARAFRFFASDKLEHLRAIEASDTGDLSPLERFFDARISPEP